MKKGWRKNTDRYNKNNNINRNVSFQHIYGVLERNPCDFSGPLEFTCIFPT